MSKKTKRLEKENMNLARKHEATNQNIIKMAEERTRHFKEMEALKRKNDNLEKLCRGMQAQGRGQTIATAQIPSLSRAPSGKHANNVNNNISSSGGGSNVGAMGATNLARHATGGAAIQPAIGVQDDEDDEDDVTESEYDEDEYTEGGYGDVETEDDEGYHQHHHHHHQQQHHHNHHHADRNNSSATVSRRPKHQLMNGKAMPQSQTQSHQGTTPGAKNVQSSSSPSQQQRTQGGHGGNNGGGSGSGGGGGTTAAMGSANNGIQIHA